MFNILLLLVIFTQGYNGYHPSAEELDSIYRQRSWTTNLIRSEQDRTQFVPRFSYWEKYKKDYKDKYYIHTVQPTKDTIKNEIKNEITDNQKLPIFFTNPVTGIVYAISEIGKGSNTTTADPTKIPIYISKEQYDRDILNIKRKYSSQCGKKPPIKKIPDTQLETPKKNTDKPVFNIKPTQTTKRPISKPGIIIPITEIPLKKLKKSKAKKIKNKKKRTRRSAPTKPSDFHFSELNPTRDKSETTQATPPQSKEVPQNYYDEDDYYNEKPDDYNYGDDYPDYKDEVDDSKRTQKQQVYDDYYEYEDYDYDSGVFSVFGMIFKPVQMVFSKFMNKAGGYISGDGSQSTRKPKFPQYTVYNNAQPTKSTWNSWFGWGGNKNKHQKMDHKPPTTRRPSTTQSSWSWFGGEDPPDDYDDDYDGNWFFGWFDTKKKAAPKTTTTTTSPPILTIADPLKNPNKWIGILAHHIVNSTSTTGQPETEDSETSTKVSYDKFQIWRLKPHSDSQVKALEDYMKTPEGLKILWLKGPSLRGLTDVLVPPKLITDFQGSLNFETIDYEVLIFDVGKAIEYEESKEKAGISVGKINWKKYFSYEDIVHYLENIQQRNPNIVELVHIGRSFEGRPLVVVKVDINRKKNQRKTQKLKKSRGNGVFIEGGVHGREWIAPATSLWMISELVKIMRNNRTNLQTEYIKNTTWFITPVINPDGYEYSRNFDRLWKKTRSKHISRANGIINSAMTWLNNRKSEKICFGVDLNRNWEQDWVKRDTPCNEFYPGPNPFSEPESRSLSKYLMDERQNIKLFISLQSYGQVISYPSQPRTSLNSQKMDDLLDVAMVGTDGLRKKGSFSRYRIDSNYDISSSWAGSSDQYTMYGVGIPFSYTIHLGDNGVHGYFLPGSYIEPVAKDVFEIVTAMIDYI
ncbi:hypothetical protein ACFFRR_002476 [Megaselia abdita]